MPQSDRKGDHVLVGEGDGGSCDGYKYVQKIFWKSFLRNFRGCVCSKVIVQNNAQGSRLENLK